MHRRRFRITLALFLLTLAALLLQWHAERMLPRLHAQDGTLTLVRSDALLHLRAITGIAPPPSSGGAVRCTLALTVDDTRGLALYLPQRAASRLLINGRTPQEYGAADSHLFPLDLAAKSGTLCVELLLCAGDSPTANNTGLCIGSAAKGYIQLSLLSVIRAFSLGISMTICLYSISLYRRKTGGYLLALAVYAALSTLWVAAMVFPGSFLTTLRKPVYDFLLWHTPDIHAQDALNTIWRMYLNFLFRGFVIREFVDSRIGRVHYLLIGTAIAAALLSLVTLLPVRNATALRALSLPLFIMLELIVLIRGEAQEPFSVTATLITWPIILALWLWEYAVRLGFVPTNLLDTYVSVGGNREMLFMIGFLFISNRRYAQKYRQADELATSLEGINAKLELQVQQKTQELRDSYLLQQQRQNAFISTIAHNLKTPLFSIIGYADMAGACTKNDPQRALKYLAGVKKNTQMMQRHVQDLLLISRLTEKRIQFHMVRIDLVALVGRTLDLMMATAMERNIRLRTRMPPALHVTADSFYLQQALQNLLDNAIAHSGGSEILLLLTEDGAQTRLCVQDNGSGIAPQTLSHIFERYYSHPGGSRAASGLGLSICHEIMLAHGGHVEAESSAEGSRFTLILPMTSDAESA